MLKNWKTIYRKMVQNWKTILKIVLFLWWTCRIMFISHHKNDIWLHSSRTLSFPIFLVSFPSSFPKYSILYNSILSRGLLLAPEKCWINPWSERTSYETPKISAYAESWKVVLQNIKMQCMSRSMKLQCMQETDIHEKKRTEHHVLEHEPEVLVYTRNIHYQEEN